MKKTMLIALMGLITNFYSPLVAQDFKGAISAGFTSSQIGGDDLSGFSKWGFYLGPKITYPVSEKISLGLQMLYTRKGSRRDNKEIRLFKGPWDKARLDYIDIPAFVKYQINSDLSLHGGLYGGVLINAQSNSVDLEADDFKRIDLGGLAGLNYEISDHLSANLRFSHSVLPIDKVDRRIIVNGQIRGLFNSNLLFGLDYNLEE